MFSWKHFKTFKRVLSVVSGVVSMLCFGGRWTPTLQLGSATSGLLSNHRGTGNRKCWTNTTREITAVVGWTTEKVKLQTYLEIYSRPNNKQTEVVCIRAWLNVRFHITLTYVSACACNLHTVITNWPTNPLNSLLTALACCSFRFQCLSCNRNSCLTHCIITRCS